MNNKDSWRDTYYRRIEGLLNEFKNKRIGYSTFIHASESIIEEVLADKGKEAEEAITEELRLLSKSYPGLDNIVEKSANLAIRNSFASIQSLLHTIFNSKGNK